MADVARFKPAGRTVRCANCGHSWFQRPTESKSTLLLTDRAPQDTALPPPQSRALKQIEAQAPADIPVKPTSWRERLFSLPTLAFALFIAVSIGAGLYQYRTPSVTKLPQSEDLYAGMGITIPPKEQLRIRKPELKTLKHAETGERVVEISGEVVNLGQNAEVIPPIKATLFDADHKALFSWTIEISQTQLGPSAARGFLSRIANPPEKTRYLDMTFVSPPPKTAQKSENAPQGDAAPAQPKAKEAAGADKNTDEDLSLSAGGYR